MYAQVEKPKENKSTAVANPVAKKRNSGKQGFEFVDNRSKAIVQKKLQKMANNNPQEIQLKSNTSNQGMVLQAMRDDWPDSVNVGGDNYIGHDTVTGVYYELPNDARANDRHISIHSAVGKTLREWYGGPGFYIKVHQTRNKYILVYFFGAVPISSNLDNAQEEGKDDALREALNMGVNFWLGLTGASHKKLDSL
jgi:hypothetical protein